MYCHLNPKKLDLEITGLIFQEFFRPFTFPCATQITSPLLVGLLEQAKVISRFPNRYLHFFLF